MLDLHPHVLVGLHEESSIQRVCVDGGLGMPKRRMTSRSPRDNAFA